MANSETALSMDDMKVQTIKNDPADRSDEANNELQKQLRTIWQESQFLVQTFNRGKEGNIDEIVKLLDEERDDV